MNNITITHSISPDDVSPSFCVHDGDRLIVRVSRETLEHLTSFHGVTVVEVIMGMIKELAPELSDKVHAKLLEFLNETTITYVGV
jgi:hypothetical protein